MVLIENMHQARMVRIYKSEMTARVMAMQPEHVVCRQSDTGRFCHLTQEQHKRKLHDTPGSITHSSVSTGRHAC